ncbi:MAG: zinc ABC transporter substrate-binding protein [Clostridia bacterium]|nr:zinc ABC transporter substrate-binding protein [Clostridia bacterium]
MKKVLCLVLSLLLCFGLFAACGSTENDSETTSAAPNSSDGLHVVCSIFPQYDVCRALMGDKGTLSILLDSKSDLHNYSPTTADILEISDSDLFIYIGGESDTWADNVLSTAANKNLQTLKLLDLVNAVEEELLPGMEAEEEEEGEEEGPEYDEHVWTSLKNMIAITGAIRDKLCELDSENASVYTANAEAYIEKLTALEARYAETIGSAKTKVLVFADRYPFRYLADDYDLTCYGAFAGCSAESEASFETMMKLVSAVKEHGLRYVLKIEGSDGKIAETVAAESGAEIRTLNSCQSVSAEDVENGATYLSLMEGNLAVLQEVLN